MLPLIHSEVDAGGLPCSCLERRKKVLSLVTATHVSGDAATVAGLRKLAWGDWCSFGNGQCTGKEKLSE